jgi:DNA-binding GntR family transcriptional regulator
VTVIGLIDVRLSEIALTGAVAAAEQSVSAAGAPAFAARHLGCDAGEPLLRIDRVYYDAEDTPVELAVSYFDPEHYSYRVKLRRRSR